MESKSMNFKLNIKNLKEIPFNMYENDFTFHLKNKEYKTNRIIADLLSPYVRQLHYLDKYSNEFYIKIVKSDDQKNDDDNDDEDENYFSDFLKLYTFEDININPKRQKYYSKYFLALGNIEEFLNLQPVFSTDINEDNVIDKLLFLININKQQDITTDIPEMLPIQNIINFISTHFEQIDKEKMKRLDNDIIERIINNKNLKLHDEDSLVTFLLDLYSKDSNTSSLFEYVIFNNLSKEMIEKFVKEFDIEYLNSSIWKAICQRLIGYDKTSTSRYIENSNVIQISLKNNDKFDGIFQHLIKETGGNIYDNGTIEITSNSVDGNHHPKNLIDYKNESSYYASDSSNKEFSFVCFDFKDKFVNLSSYVMRSNNNSDGLSNPKSWIIEVSNDGKKWDEIDRQENSSSLKGSEIECEFKVRQTNKGFYRYIRLHQTGPGWGQNGGRIWFYKMELYGSLKYLSK